MKKFIFFLMLILTITLCKTTNVYASTVNFYEGEYIDGIYMNKRANGSNTIYYQKARFFRQSGTNDFAYCIEPFNFFNESAQYQSTINPSSLSAYQKTRISMIAHFGYGYGSHTDSKWYAITQFMIWQTADPNGDFYFTEGLNGTRVQKFTSEMNEINSLINNYQISPSIINKEYDLVEGESLNITDTNNILNSYSSSNSLFKISNNKLISDELKEGSYDIKLTRSSRVHNRPIIFYQASNSQDLVETGDIDSKSYNLKVNVIKTSVEITKIDSDTKTTKPSGDAELKGAIYGLYDTDMNKLKEISIDNNSIGFIENISFGKYYLKEIKAGIGYNLDDKTYEVNISKNDPNIKLTLENKVIKAKVAINKSYEGNNAEGNVVFNIYNKSNKLITTITTDNSGYAEVILPYGRYKVKQLNSKDGYYKVEDFFIDVLSSDNLIYNLTDYKIKVPNTRSNNSFLDKLIKIIMLICLRKFVTVS
ncbi:MAG: Cys-Gln thioester bond-forming surface protein [Bacilli bacterium]|nr:Cys-Gln thioester bond-forming surface protein [Bacilli bacterium]